MKRTDWLGAVRVAAERLIWARSRPLVLGMMITDRCNLNCFYCGSRNRGRCHFTLMQARSLLQDAFARGHRILVLTGGEPMLWRDGPAALRDVVGFAYEIGFIDVFVFTNGTFPLDIPRCRYYVTIDGPRPEHEKVRPGTYERILENVRAAAGGHVYASITLHRANAAFLEDFIEEASSLRLFRGISFNFLTAEPEVVERDGIPLRERGKLLDRLWRMKMRGHPIMLSRAAMNALRNNNWRRPLPQIEFATSQRTFQCCRDVDNPGVCSLCGYSTCVELSQLMSLKPSAVFEQIRAF